MGELVFRRVDGVVAVLCLQLTHSSSHRLWLPDWSTPVAPRLLSLTFAAVSTALFRFFVSSTLFQFAASAVAGAAGSWSSQLEVDLSAEEPAGVLGAAGFPPRGSVVQVSAESAPCSTSPSPSRSALSAASSLSRSSSALLSFSSSHSLCANATLSVSSALFLLASARRSASATFSLSHSSARHLATFAFSSASRRSSSSSSTPLALTRCTYSSKPARSSSLVSVTDD
ncbi:hypothetical protein JCM11251_004241 [Rhodosporidiobolus azoricus]